METEIWKDIEGYEGKYLVSNKGRVNSLNYHRSGREQCLKPWKNTNGYLQVTLYKNGKKKYPRVHQLVLKAFDSNPNNLPEVNHKTEDKTMNCVECIEWCDRGYNINYGTRNERVSKKLRNREDLSKPVICVETGEIYPSAREAARCTGANFSHINECCRGKLKKTKGYHWQYAE